MHLTKTELVKATPARTLKPDRDSVEEKYKTQVKEDWALGVGCHPRSILAVRSAHEGTLRGIRPAAGVSCVVLALRAVLVVRTETVEMGASMKLKRNEEYA